VPEVRQASHTPPEAQQQSHSKTLPGVRTHRRVENRGAEEMKITESQLIVLLQTTVETLKIGDGMGLFSFCARTRETTVNEVVGQQTAILETAEE
jgi:hypothetical protein